MLKREITYKYFDDDGKEVEETETFWFHLSEEEMMEWLSKEKDLVEDFQRYIKEEDSENLFAMLKKVILDSYGHRESGGRVFEKSPELRKRFENSLAYKKLFRDLTIGENSATLAAEFINGVMPDLSDIPDQDKPQPQVKTAKAKALN